MVDICDTRIKMEPDDVEDNDLADSGMEISNGKLSVMLFTHTRVPQKHVFVCVSIVVLLRTIPLNI